MVSLFKSFSIGNASVINLGIRLQAVYKKPASRSASQTHQDVFKQNLVKIAEHNLRFRAGTKKWEKGVNQFTDMIASELERMKCYKGPSASSVANYSSNSQPLELSDDVPDSFDWRDQGHVTSVKDQGQCGSCYAFAATGCLESIISREYQVDVDLSEQEIVDCTYGQHRGCNGGTSPNTFGYMQKVGQTTESSYPYEAVEGTCRADGKPHVARVSDFWDIEPDEEAIKQAVAQYGPIPVGINANEDFVAYAGNDIFESDCDGDINHAVLIVGYGSGEEYDYWIIKNSWGTWWGDNGYMYMARNYPNMCGIGTLDSNAMAITAVYDA
jgi:cathepsin L